MPEYELRHRRPANITVAHENDIVFVFDIQIVGSINIFMVYTTVYNIFYCISVSLCNDKQSIYMLAQVYCYIPEASSTRLIL